MQLPEIRSPGVSSVSNIGLKSPFLLENESEYRLWKQAKLDLVGRSNASEALLIHRDYAMGETIMADVIDRFQAFNFVKYCFDDTLDPASSDVFLHLTRQFGLQQIDANLAARASGISEIQAVSDQDHRSQYIPYTNRALNWHTDGYYNPPEQQIAAFALHCVRPAEKGGENFFFDHEMMYLKIREVSEDLIAALMDPELMVIPANVQDNQVIRTAQSGPVFSVDYPTQQLRMRYSARPRNISWKNDKTSQRAVELIREILMDDDQVQRMKLDAGQGVICNNLLHGRTAFLDSGPSASRLYLRARFCNPVEIKQ
ncbi:MAG: TauD/TfdA family dioxygenase [Pseudomonadota bacterium]